MNKAKIESETLAHKQSEDQKAKKENVYVITDNHADAIVFLPKFEMDAPTIGQIKKMITHPAIVGSKIRVMPDCHKAIGCCVGFTYGLQEKIVPNYIGSDISCGILTYPVGQELLRRHSLKKIEK